MSQSSKGKYYVKKEKRMLRDQGVYSRFDIQQSKFNVGILLYTYLLNFPL
jgi:hypothetical protein